MQTGSFPASARSPMGPSVTTAPDSPAGNHAAERPTGDRALSQACHELWPGVTACPSSPPVPPSPPPTPRGALVQHVLGESEQDGSLCGRYRLGMIVRAAHGGAAARANRGRLR